MNNYNQFTPIGYAPYTPYGLQQNQQAFQQANTPYHNNQNMNNFQQSYNPPINTNIIFVNGIEDVRNRPLPPNSNYAFMDNDKAILYRKVVDSMGKMNVELYDITPHKEEQSNNAQAINTSDFVTRKEYEALKSQLEQQNGIIRQLTQDKQRQNVKTANSSPIEVNKK